MSRIEGAFAQLKKEGRLGIVPYLTVGYPDLAATLELVPALEEAGAALVELGVPFSDPLADGATIQRASFHALKQGVNLARCLEMAFRLREAGVRLPLVLMGYYNPFFQFGLERLATTAAAAGVDGFIVPDLPPEEGGALAAACRGEGLDLIFLVAPTSTEERIRRVVGLSSGFIYCVSLAGVTGARGELWSGLTGFLDRVRHLSSLPLAVGFGISRSDQVAAVAPHAEAVVVGSALIDLVEGLSPAERGPRAAAYLAELSAGGR